MFGALKITPYLGCHSIPDFRALTVPPHIICFGTGIKDHNINETQYD